MKANKNKKSSQTLARTKFNQPKPLSFSIRNILREELGEEVSLVRQSIRKPKLAVKEQNLNSKQPSVVEKTPDVSKIETETLPEEEDSQKPDLVQQTDKEIQEEKADKDEKEDKQKEQPPPFKDSSSPKKEESSNSHYRLNYNSQAQSKVESLLKRLTGGEKKVLSSPQTNPNKICTKRNFKSQNQSPLLAKKGFSNGKFKQEPLLPRSSLNSRNSEISRLARFDILKKQEKPSIPVVVKRPNKEKTSPSISKAKSQAQLFSNEKTKDNKLETKKNLSNRPFSGNYYLLESKKVSKPDTNPPKELPKRPLTRKPSDPPLKKVDSYIDLALQGFSALNKLNGNRSSLSLSQETNPFRFSPTPPPIPPNNPPNPPSNTTNTTISPSLSAYRVEGKYLGKGTFAVVRKATRKEDGLSYALKTFQRVSLLPLHLDNLKNEIEILQSLSHPCIIKLYSTIECTRNIHLVMELGGDENLEDYLTRNRSPSKWPSLLRRFF